MAGLAVISLLTPLWVMAALAFLNGLFVWRFFARTTQAQRASPTGRLRYTDPRILPYVCVGVLMFMGFALVQQTMGFRFQTRWGSVPGKLRRYSVLP